MLLSVGPICMPACDTWRILIALTATHLWHIKQLDIVGAYLHGDLEERIFIKQFPLLEHHFKDHPDKAIKYRYTKDKVIELLRPLYRLKQSGYT